MTQLDKLMIAFKSSQSGITTFTPVSTINSTAKSIIRLTKDWQLKILPEKYYFDSSYNSSNPNYVLYSTGKYQNKTSLLEETINDYITLM